MFIKRFWSRLFRRTHEETTVTHSGVGVYGNNTTVENIHIHQNPRHLANQDDLESEIRAYCEKADTLYNFIPLAGFRTRLKVPIDLEQMFVPLRAVMDTRTAGDTCFGGAEEADTFFRARGHGQEIPLTEAFHRAGALGRTGIVILGDPGAGKTTHLKRLLLWCLRGNLEALGLPKDMIPVFLPLRELRDLSKGLDAFIQAQLNHRHLNTPDGFGRQMLNRQNLLFLFDGLDEVSDPDQRAKVSRWLEEARTLFPDCWFVVTCRFAGYREKAQMDAHFLEMHLRPLDTDQAQTFIRNWYRIMETAWQKDREQAEELASQKADELIRLLKRPEFRARKVFHLTRNPLLLTNICLIHQSRGNLPRTRAQLYEECIDVLLELWRDAVGYTSRIDAVTGKRILQPAALWLHGEEGRTRATAGELAPILDPVIQKIKWPHGKAGAFLAAVRDDSGLLTEWGNDQFGFMHLGFQEYLAAREIRDQYLEARADGRETTAVSDLAEHFHQGWWQEVGLLLLALDARSFFVPFMRAFTQSPAFLSNPDLIDLCLDDAGEVSARPFIELVEADAAEDKDSRERRERALDVIRQIDPETYRKLQPSKTHRPDTPHAITAPRGGYVLVGISGGTFMMGAPESEKDGQEYERPIHRVKVPDFYLGKYPVTNAEYERFLKANPERNEPKYWSDREFNRPNQPLVGVSFNDAGAYAQWAGLCLPSEAQWEYACRAGTQTSYYTGDDEKSLDRAGWYRANSENRLHPVGQKEPNDFGLYDMHGNIFEWVADQFHETYKGAPDDGTPLLGMDEDAFRVIRGGSWSGPAGRCRAAYRLASLPGYRIRDLGFRLALPG